MVKAKLHEANGDYCFVEVEIEADDEDTLITRYIAFLKKLRLAHSELEEKGITGKETASKKQLDTIRRLAKEQRKELSSITDYVAKKFRAVSLPNLTKEEASHVLDLMIPKKGDENAEVSV